MEDEIYLRHIAYHRLLEEGYTREEAVMFLEGPGWEKFKRVGAMGLAGLASMAATPKEVDAAPPTEARQSVQDHQVRHGHKIYYSGPMKDGGEVKQVVVVEVKDSDFGGSNRVAVKTAHLVAKAELVKLVTGESSGTLSGVKTETRNTNKFGLVVVVKWSKAQSDNAKTLGDKMNSKSILDRGNEYERRVADTDF